jgi:hypothetical protein
MARNKWVLVTNPGKLTRSEWEHYVKQSYELIKAKLPKKLQGSIEKAQGTTNKAQGTTNKAQGARNKKLGKRTRKKSKPGNK